MLRTCRGSFLRTTWKPTCYPQLRLLRALQEKVLEIFKKIVNCNKSDVDNDHVHWCFHWLCCHCIATSISYDHSYRAAFTAKNQQINTAGQSMFKEKWKTWSKISKKPKNILRTFWGSFWEKLKNIEAEPLFQCSYKKNSV